MIPEGLKRRDSSPSGDPRERDARLSTAQALLAAKAGAAFISPFIGRLDDIGRTAWS